MKLIVRNSECAVQTRSVVKWAKKGRNLTHSASPSQLRTHISRRCDVFMIIVIISTTSLDSSYHLRKLRRWSTLWEVSVKPKRFFLTYVLYTHTHTHTKPFFLNYASIQLRTHHFIFVSLGR